MSIESSKKSESKGTRIEGLDYALLSSLIDVEIDEVEKEDFLSNINPCSPSILKPNTEFDTA